MPCRTTPPPLTLSQQLTLEYSYVKDMTPGQPQKLLIRYWTIRQLILDMIFVAPDAHAFTSAWESINHFGQASAYALQTGQIDEFDRLKALIQQTYEMVP